MNGVNQLNYAGGWRDALEYVCKDRFWKPGKCLNTFTKALGEVELAAHCAFGDFSNFGALTCDIGEEFDYLILDQGAVNVKHDKYFAHEAILPDAAT
jgi:hypothetical protein